MKQLYPFLSRLTQAVGIAWLAALAAPTARAQTLPFNWARVGCSSSVGSSAGNTALVAAVAANATGDFLVVGTFTGQVGLGNTVLSSAGGSDVFVAKYTASGWAWAVRGGGTGDDLGAAIAVNGPEVYITGRFTSNGSASFAGTTLAGAGLGDAFVAKYTDAGSSALGRWAVSGGGSNADQGLGIAVAGSAVYVTGSFSSNSGVRLAGTALAGAGNVDIYLAKYLDGGATVSDGWAVSGGGSDADQGYSVAVQGRDVYVAGTFYSPSASLAGTTLTGAGSGDILLAKYTDDGPSPRGRWATSGGGTGADGAYAVDVAGSSVYVAGFVASASGARVAGSSLPGAGGTDALLAKYTDTGAGVADGWAVTAGGTGFDQATGVAAPGGMVYATGFFSSNANAQVAGTALAGAGSTDVFVAQYADAGSSAIGNWVRSAGGAGDDFARGMALAGGIMCIGGDVMPPATFGLVSLAATTGTQTAFLAQMVANPTSTRAPQLPGSAVYPTPAHGLLHLTLPVPVVQATLRNGLGQLVLHGTLTAASALLDVRGLPPGVYTLQLQAGAALATHRVVLE